MDALESNYAELEHASTINLETEWSMVYKDEMPMVSVFITGKTCGKK